jgi:hypothetical protein
MNAIWRYRSRSARETGASKPWRSTLVGAERGIGPLTILKSVGVVSAQNEVRRPDALLEAGGAHRTRIVGTDQIHDAPVADVVV